MYLIYNIIIERTYRNTNIKFLLSVKIAIFIVSLLMFPFLNLNLFYWGLFVFLLK